MTDEQWVEVTPGPYAKVCDEMHERNSSGLHVQGFCRACAEIYEALNIAPGVVEWHAECDKVGIPHDPELLVRHHRANAGMAAVGNAMSSARSVARARDDVQKVLVMLDADAKSLREQGIKRTGDYSVARHLLGGVEGYLIQAVKLLPPITPISSTCEGER